MRDERFTATEKKRVRHARIPFRVTTCQDCGRGLHITHDVLRFGSRCRPCYSRMNDDETLLSVYVDKGSVYGA